MLCARFKLVAVACCLLLLVARFALESADVLMRVALDAAKLVATCNLQLATSRASVFRSRFIFPYDATKQPTALQFPLFLPVLSGFRPVLSRICPDFALDSLLAQTRPLVLLMVANIH